MNSQIRKAYRQIAELKIQGARNVALYAIKALRHVRRFDELKKAADYLASARPTEPMLRNALKYVLSQADAADVGGSVGRAVEEFEQIAQKAIEQIVRIGRRRIPRGNVMTKCHSSTVTAILKRAAEKKQIAVWVCETRPLYQGRRTAQELADAGIDVTLIIDDAKKYFINEMQLVIVGADALTADGSVINKIGTADLAAIAHMAETPFCVAAELLKFDPITVRGYMEPIEERSWREVWAQKPKGVKIRNPAFEAVAPQYVNYVITEAGIVSPYAVIEKVVEKYPWVSE